MAFQTKIATCCYCASRTILKPSARGGHELACGSCGAPLHDMKWLKQPERKPEPAPKPQKPVQTRQNPQRFAQTHTPKTKKPKKRRKPLWQRGLEEVWDIIEDIID